MAIFGRQKVVTLREELEKILDDLKKADKDIEAAIILRNDGLVITASMYKETDVDLVAAMLTTILGVSNRVLGELAGGPTEDIVIKGKDKLIAIISITDELLLGAIAGKDAKLGLLLFEMKRTAEKVRKVIEK